MQHYGIPKSEISYINKTELNSVVLEQKFNKTSNEDTFLLCYILLLILLMYNKIISSLFYNFVPSHRRTQFISQLPKFTIQ